MAEEENNQEEGQEEYVPRAQHEQTQRELAFLKAGVNTDTPMGKYFAQGYDGELDPESIKAEAQQVGLVQGEEEEDNSQQTNNNPQLTAEEQNQANSRRNLATGGLPDTGEGEDPYQTARRTHSESIDAGASKDDALAAGIGQILSAAANGDERVMYRPGQ